MVQIVEDYLEKTREHHNEYRCNKHKILIFRSSFVVYDIQYLEHNTNKKQSERLFPLFELLITLGFKSEVSAYIYLEYST